MFKLKPVLRYLGAGDPELNARTNARCPSCSPPVNPTTAAYLAGAVAEVVSTGWLEPKVVKLTNSTGLVIYRNSAGTQIRGRVVTIKADMSISLGTEQTLVTAAAIIQALSLTYLSDNKVLLAYRQSTNCTARVLNISGATVTAGALTVVNTEVASVYGTGPIRCALYAPLTVMLCFTNTDNTKASLQVLTISALDVVTAGAVAKSTVIGNTQHQVAMTTTTTGVTVSFGTRAVLETFTVAGAVVTFSGVSTSFPNTTQIPGPTTFTMGSGTMHLVDSNTVLVCGVTSTLLPTVTSAMYSFLADISGTTITSTTILKQDTETGTVPVSVLMGGESAVIYRKFVSGSDYIPRLLYNNVAGSTPTTDYQESLVTSKYVGYPEIDKISSYNALIFWEGGTTGVEITGMATRIT